jgi:hypothetical protein
LKKIHHKKRAGGVAQGIGPEFKSQYHTKTKIYIENISKSLKVISDLLKLHLIFLLKQKKNIYK